MKIREDIFCEIYFNSISFDQFMKIPYKSSYFRRNSNSNPRNICYRSLTLCLGYLCPYLPANSVGFPKIPALLKTAFFIPSKLYHQFCHVTAIQILEHLKAFPYIELGLPVEKTLVFFTVISEVLRRLRPFDSVLKWTVVCPLGYYTPIIACANQITITMNP